MMTRADRGRPPGTAVGIIGTVVVHAAAVGLLVTHVQSSKASPPTYAVELVAAPAPTQKQRLAREAVPTPPPPEKPAPVKPQPPKPTKAPPVPTPKAQPRDSNKEPPPKTAAPVTPLPGETPSTGTDVASIKTPGLQFPYPEYLRNIVTQVYRNWDRQAARENAFAEVRKFVPVRLKMKHSINSTSSSTHSLFGNSRSRQGASNRRSRIVDCGAVEVIWQSQSAVLNP